MANDIMSQGKRGWRGNMAARAYILIETAVGKTREVVAALKGLEGAKRPVGRPPRKPIVWYRNRMIIRKVVGVGRDYCQLPSARLRKCCRKPAITRWS
jgi:hypothetical protein